MKVTRIMKLAWGAMKNRKLRAMLTILGITIGPAVIVALVGATQGFSVSVTERFNSMGITTIFVTLNQRSNLHLDDTVARAVSQIPGVTYVVPYYTIQATTTGSTQTSTVTIIALDISKLQSLLPGIKLADGTFPTSPAQAIIGSTVANPQDGSRNIPLNGAISISINARVGSRTVKMSRAFIAVGVLQTFGQSFFVNPDNTVFVPLAAGQSIRSQQGATRDYSGFYVIASTPDDVSNVQSAITDLYGNNVRVMAISSFVSTIQSVIGGINSILVSIAFMSVIVAFIGIMTTMFTSVAERTREIGILKSLGYSPRDILTIFLSEATLTGAIGGLAGIALGSFLSFAVIGMFGGGLRFGGPGFGPGPGAGQSAAQALAIMPIITPELLIGTFLMSVSIGALAGLLPSWRASKLIPVVALRHE